MTRAIAITNTSAANPSGTNPYTALPLDLTPPALRATSPILLCKTEAELQGSSCAIASDRLDYLMQKKGLSKKQLADAIGKRPNEITRWLSGEHNFTISTLAMLSAFSGEPLVVATHNA